MIRVKAFRAIDDPEACLRFINGHRRILEIFGVTKVTSANVEWASDPNVYVILAESMEGDKAFGGARVHVVDHLKSKPLPIESAVSELDSKIHDIVKEHAAHGTGELCGLWNSREVAGRGLGSVFLTRAAVAISDQLKVKSLFALCASYTVKMGQNAGFAIETSLGNHGTFYYPKEDFVATVMILDDVLKLDHADPIEKEKILFLRKNKNQAFTENGVKGDFEIQFDLSI